MSLLQEHEAARILLDGWVEDLSQVLESMTDQRPMVHWRPASGTAAGLGVNAGTDTLWSQFKLHCPQEVDVWIVTPRVTWEHIGTAILQATGLEASDPEEIKKTWLEILSQWISAFARSLGSHLGREVTSEDNGERATEVSCEWVFTSLRFGDADLPPIAAALSPAVAGLLTGPVSSERSTAAASREPDFPQANPESVPASRTLDLLLDVELPVSISFGKTQLPLKDVLKLTTGSIVELNRGVNEPVEVLVNHCLVARGEVVVVEGNYGVRIQQIASREDRMRSVR
ncbi:MAG: flagellar motor switch protein FliN [Acidobacteriia bacterium]|nr:flagellar motor switch protein FliN [Terriglobia bacterium]